MRTKRLQKVVVNTTITFFVIAMVAVAAVPAPQKEHTAYAHTVGTGSSIRNIDNYQIAFQSIPTSASAGQNTSLHFSILENNAYVNNAHVALQIKEKESGKIVEQVPYKLYEFSDITIPYTFQNNTDYEIKLLARMSDDGGNQKYLTNPMVVDFDIPVRQTTIVPINDFIITAVPFAAALAGGIVFMLKRAR
ncbi:hypothetical protein [Nitrososphaera viennensis]|uniref:Uncharacterized protein n=2 Tax=Nitrososphaera viennensis TaxID=1034015 RepID=A0A060HQJ3_9ARCH|nr:hypothetical protein [Nitrososphaera viennensis]AIC15816.1 exported protein of unknown function [Nitrososphaera viennensis EN76]UVS67812.1 hypothetical protein NWT39_07820 [Nitrososphaera viennensis]